MQVKVRKRFPLTSIFEVVYDEKENPIAFILQFEKSEILLEARDQLDCQVWVKDIQKGRYYLSYIIIIVYNYRYSL